MNAEITVFVISVEVIIYWLLHNWHECTFNIFRKALVKNQHFKQYYQG